MGRQRNAASCDGGHRQWGQLRAMEGVGNGGTRAGPPSSCGCRTQTKKTRERDEASGEQCGMMYQQIVDGLQHRRRQQGDDKGSVLLSEAVVSNATRKL